MAIGLDEFPALARASLGRLLEGVEQRRVGSTTIATELAEQRRLGVLRDFRATTVVEFGLSVGLSASESRDMANLSKALGEVPELAEEVKAGDLTVDGATKLGRTLKNDDLIDAEVQKIQAAAAAQSAVTGETVAVKSEEDARREVVESFHQAAKTLPAHEFQEFVDRRVEEARLGESVWPITFHLTGTYHKRFRRVRELVSQKARRPVTNSHAIEVAVDHYLHDFDLDSVEDGTRRMPPTGGKQTRTVPAEVKRAVRARTNGRCIFPACQNRTWLQFAHRKPWRQGGSQEKDNIDALCTDHHRRVDAGEFRIEGSTESPVFYDSRGRRIAPNGRPIDPSGAGPP